MTFLVYGRDASTFDETDHPLHEEHQSYMDTWADQLVARGPTLSEDGARHTGSVHVLHALEPETAQRFAFEEPYARSGWYADVAVSRYESLLPGTMWDRPAPAAGPGSSYVQVFWTPQPRTSELVDSIVRRVLPGLDNSWVFVGLLLSDGADQVVGLAGGLDLPVPEASRWLGDLVGGLGVTNAGLDVRRWRRGGRSA